MWLQLLLSCLEAVLCLSIVHLVPYTEIDYSTYMQQITQILQGQLDYSLVGGSTGRIVYGGGYVLVYSGIQQLLGSDVFSAQLLFVGVHLLLLVTCFTAYSRAHPGISGLALVLLCTSYRVHSITVLRLFNDSVMAWFMWLSFVAACRRSFVISSFFLSFAVSVKMAAVLPLPALACLMLRSASFSSIFMSASVFILVQIAVGAPFLATNAAAYLGQTFELTRVFMYKWTVNWRILPEEMFLSAAFASALLMLHLGLLLLFSRRWLGGSYWVRQGPPLTE